MTYNSFINAYKGKSVDFDGVPKKDPVQCVDLVKYYLRDVFSITAGAWGNARDYYECFNSKSWGGYRVMNSAFTRIENTPDFIPMKGDIAVWGSGLSQYGHIAICDGIGTTSYFYSYDQNWNGKACKRVKHSYKGFLGVLRPKRKVTSAVNIRTGPGTTYLIKGEKKKNEKVTLYEIKGNFGRIGKNQWVHLNYLSDI